MTTAIIYRISIGADSLETLVEFSVDDGSQVSFYDTINQAHACFLAEHTGICSDHSGYAKMIRAIADNSDEALLSLLNAEFNDTPCLGDVIDEEHGTCLGDADLVACVREDYPEWETMSEQEQFSAQIAHVAPMPRFGEKSILQGIVDDFS